jgi:hypothetical protein
MELTVTRDTDNLTVALIRYDTILWDITPCRLTDVLKDRIVFISSVQKSKRSRWDSLTLRWLHFSDPSIHHYFPRNIPRDLKFKSHVLQSKNITSKIKALIQIFNRDFITCGRKTNIFSWTIFSFFIFVRTA